MNIRQDRLALFLNCFMFTLSCHPRSNNSKPDTLCHQFDSSEEPSSPDKIHLSTKVKASRLQYPAPSACPANQNFFESDVTVGSFISTHLPSWSRLYCDVSEATVFGDPPWRQTVVCLLVQFAHNIRPLDECLLAFSSPICPSEALVSHLP